MPFAEIRNDTVILKNGGLRAVLQIEPINFNLKSETEQIGIISGYESFINTLTFPIQILIRSTKVDIDQYLELVDANAKKQNNQLLKDQTVSYGKFVKKIVDLADIMAKKFYLVVPLDDATKKQTPLNRFLEWMNTDDSASKKGQRDARFNAMDSRLRERVDLIDAGLRAIGLGTKRMNTLELISLYYEIYNRNQRQSQKLPIGTDLNSAPDIL